MEANNDWIRFLLERFDTVDSKLDAIHTRLGAKADSEWVQSLQDKHDALANNVYKIIGGITAVNIILIVLYYLGLLSAR